MCRVATEVRIFHLLVNMTGETSLFLQPLMQELEKKGYRTQLRKVPCEFQRAGDQMLQIFTKQSLKSINTNL